MSNQAQQILQQLYKAVETDQIKLPTLPEVALKIRQAVENDNHTASEVAELLSQDTSLSARLLQLTNSPLYRAKAEINNLQTAVTRLGIRMVKELVIMLAIKQAFQANNKVVAKQFKKIWQTSIEVAAACRILAKKHHHLNPEQAVMAGLIHNIGALPFIELANNHPELASTENEFKILCNEIQGPLGEKILKHWNFPQSLINVTGQWNNCEYRNDDGIDYVNIVQTAIFHTQQQTHTTTDESTINSNIEHKPEPSSLPFDELELQQLEEIRSSLMSI